MNKSQNQLFADALEAMALALRASDTQAAKPTALKKTKQALKAPKAPKAVKTKATKPQKAPKAPAGITLGRWIAVSRDGKPMDRLYVNGLGKVGGKYWLEVGVKGEINLCSKGYKGEAYAKDFASKYDETIARILAFVGDSGWVTLCRLAKNEKKAA